MEDLGSQNGVKVGKVEDGECYRVIHRPCKVVAGGCSLHCEYEAASDVM